MGEIVLRGVREGFLEELMDDGGCLILRQAMGPELLVSKSSTLQSPRLGQKKMFYLIRALLRKEREKSIPLGQGQHINCLPKFR